MSAADSWGLIDEHRLSENQGENENRVRRYRNKTSPKLSRGGKLSPEIGSDVKAAGPLGMAAHLL